MDNAIYTPDQGIKETFFRADNRLNRKRYIHRALGIGFCSAIITTIVNALGEDASMILLGLFMILSLVLMVSSFMLVIRRLHDLDKSGWFSLIAFVPVVNFIFGLYILLKKGTEGQNRFGADPLT